MDAGDVDPQTGKVKVPTNGSSFLLLNIPHVSVEIFQALLSALDD